MNRLDIWAKHAIRGDEVVAMPTYDYRCKACSHKFEVKRSFSDDSPVHCPQCGDEAQRLFSSPTILLKGQGFYTTDRQKRSWWQKPGMEESMADAKLTMDKALVD